MLNRKEVKPMYEEAFVRGLKRKIEEDGLKQVVIAEKSGIKPDVFSKIVNGKRRVFADEAIAISTVLNTPIERLIEEAKG
jgi:plasmid maintenance system antidote protein VapI